MSFLDLRSVNTYKESFSKLEKEENQNKFVVYDEKNKGFVAKSSHKIFKKLDDKPQKYSDGEEKWSERGFQVITTITRVSQKIGASAMGAFNYKMQNCGEDLNKDQMDEIAFSGIKIRDELIDDAMLFLTKGKGEQKSGHELITCGDVSQAIDRANVSLNKHYTELRPKILGQSEGQIEEKPETGKADARTSGATTTTSSSVKAKGVSNVETGGGKVSTKDAEKKPRLLSSFKAFTSTALPKQTDPEHKQKRSLQIGAETLRGRPDASARTTREKGEASDSR
jgi:hypothetical protein